MLASHASSDAQSHDDRTSDVVETLAQADMPERELEHAAAA